MVPSLHEQHLLAYVQESKLGALQIQWLCELALFDFTINTKQAVPTGLQMH